MTSDRKPSIHGFLGSTSFASVFNESQSLLRSQYSTQPQSAPRLTDEDVNKAASCLSIVRDLQLYNSIIQKWKHMTVLSMIVPWMDAIQESMDRDIYQGLAGKEDAEADTFLKEVSRRIWTNTYTPIIADGTTTLQQYEQRVVGENLRWESVGMWFTAAGLAVEALEYVDGAWSARDSFRARRDLARKMLEAADSCITFCQKTGQITDPMTWLYMEDYHLCTLVDGDASFSSWLRLGNTISIVVAKGLHGNITPSDDVPFWLSETRKRVFGITYISDKGCAHFLGRPPRLPRKYCAMQLPLDLNPEHLRLPQAELEKEVNRLDENGWNVQGYLRGTAFVRTGLISHMINEDILELMMSSLPMNYEQVAQDILRRSRSAWEALPGFVKGSLRSAASAGGPHADIIDVVSLDFQANEFLLQRVLIQKHLSKSDELLRISAEMLSKVLTLIRQHNSTRFTHDLPWIISKYALPGAGVLCIELLRQHQGHRISLSFNRSEVIQNLSSLAATLKWIVTKRTVNHEIVDQARLVIQKVLDTVLAAPHQSTSQSFHDAEGTEYSNASTPSMDILQQAQSEPEFWALLPQHPLLAESNSGQ